MLLKNNKINMKKGVDYTGVCVVFFCHDGNGNFLMGKRSENSRDEYGKWDIGGGGLEYGERVEENLEKEIKEEFNANVLDYEFLGYRDVHREHEGKKTHWIGLDFCVRIDREKVKIMEPEKMSDIGWFTFGNYPEECHSQFGKFLELHREKIEKIINK